MGEPIKATFGCGCEISEGKFTKVCKNDAKQGRKVGSSIWNG